MVIVPKERQYLNITSERRQRLFQRAGNQKFARHLIGSGFS